MKYQLFKFLKNLLRRNDDRVEAPTPHAAPPRYIATRTTADGGLDAAVQRSDTPDADDDITPWWQLAARRSNRR